jgi:hypothetical protein
VWSTGLRTRRRSHPGWLSLLREMSRSCGIAWGWITGSWPLLSGPQESVIYSGSNLHREDFAHLQVARSVVSIAYLPLFHKGQLAGAIELLSFSEILSASDLDASTLCSVSGLLPSWVRRILKSRTEGCSIQSAG